MILDFSVAIAGYRSDFTNTVAVSRPTKLQAAQADACIRALLVAESTLFAGGSCSAVYDAVNATLVERDFRVCRIMRGMGLRWSVRSHQFWCLRARTCC